MEPLLGTIAVCLLLGRCWYFREFLYISGRHGNAYWGREAMLSELSLAVCVCRLERLIRASRHIQQHKLAEKVDKRLSNEGH